MKEATIISITLAILMIGCPPKNMQLNESLFYFNNAYRWKRTDVSSDFVHPLYKPSILKVIRNHERNVSISELEIEDIFVDEKRGIALIKIRISYLLSNETILREEVISQYWVKEDSKWFFVGQSGSDTLTIPISDELKPRIFPEEKDAGTSDN